MSNYAEMLSEQGIKDMIEDIQEKIERLKFEREDVGKSWTESHIECHKKRIDEEIEEYKNEIIEFEEALKVKLLQTIKQ